MRRLLLLISLTFLSILLLTQRADAAPGSPCEGPDCAIKQKATPVNVGDLREPRPQDEDNDDDSGVYYIYILHEPTLPAGWVYVQQYLVGSGCEGYTCGSDWTPNSIRNLFEKPGDRTYRGHGEGDGSPPFPLAIWDGRDRCGDGNWAAGTWYHNGYFNLVWNPPVCWFDPNRFGPGEGAYICDYYGQWSGPTSEGWNFAENDACFRNPPPPTDPSPPDHPPGNPTPMPPAGDPDPTPTPCPSESGYIVPTMVGFHSEPAYPVVTGQGGDGFRAVGGFRGGIFWQLDCTGRHETPDNIVRVDVVVQLSEESRRWIEGTLAPRYPGAHVKDTYPQQYTVFRGNRPTVWARFPASGDYFPARDPGTYILTWRVHTQSGRVFTFSREVQVHLVDSTMGW